MRTRIVIGTCACLLLLSLVATAPVWAQQTQKRSEIEVWPVGAPEEVSYRPWDPYNLSVMLEIGGQVADVNGNKDVYDTHQNYRDGFKVFSFNIRGEGKDDGAFLTDFYAQGGGWVNEPYSWTKFGFSKDKWFDFRGQFRESEYRFFFPLGHTFARNLHRDWTERRFQDYDLTIFPKQKFRVKLGYNRNSTFGPTFTTSDYDRDVMLLFEPLRQTYDEYTIGAEWNVQRWLILGEYGYRYFRNDRCMDNPDLRCTFESLDDPAAGIRNQGENLPTSGHGADGSATDIFRRSYPARGKVPFARVNLVGRPLRTLEVSAGLRYSRAESEFTFDQNIVGHTRSTSNINAINFRESIEAFGASLRPLTTFDGNITWRPLQRLTITNNFQFRGYTQSGFIDERVIEDPGLPTEDTEEVREATIVDLDTFFNRIEGRYNFTSWFGVRGGFNYTKRDYRFFEFAVEDGVVAFEQECVDEFGLQAEHCDALKYLNRSVLYGVDLRFNRRAQFFFDAEVGNHTRIITRVSPANIDRYRLRGRFEPWDGLRFNASWFIFDTSNFNLPTRNPVVLDFPDQIDPINPGDVQDNCADDPSFYDNNAPGLRCLLPGRHTTRNRGFTIDFQLTRWERGYFDVGYSRNDITALTDVLFRTEGGGGPGGDDFFHRPLAEYILNDNYFYFDLGGRIAGNLYGEVGYRVTWDSGTFPTSDPTDPCNVQTYLAFSGGFILPDPLREPGTPEGCGDFVYGFPFDPADSPPTGDGSDRIFEVIGFENGAGLKNHQPHASLRYSINENITWKGGWRWYGYNVKLGTFSDYKAHVVTTSLVLNF